MYAIGIPRRAVVEHAQRIADEDPSAFAWQSAYLSNSVPDNCLTPLGPLSNLPGSQIITMELMFFDFLKSFGYSAPNVRRMNLRWDHIIKPFERELAGARVLDLAAHDGRWSYAFAGAGAKEVVAIEGRQDLVEKYSYFPSSPFKNVVKISAGDLFQFCRSAVASGEQFDVVAMLGIFYHIMSHYDLLVLASRMKPKLIIIDSTFLDVPQHVIRVQNERTDLARNAISHLDGQRLAPVGIVSLPALDRMAATIGYAVRQVPWTDIPNPKTPVEDYFRPGQTRRFTVELRPARS